MRIVEKMLGDVLVISPADNCGGNGSTCVFSVNQLAALGITAEFVQDNQSLSNHGVIRGLHYQIQHPQAKLVHVSDGSITDVVVDLRRSSPNFGKYSIIELSGSNGLILFIPQGYAHGFMVTSTQATVLYKVTDYRYPEYERTLLWNDPELAIPWSVNHEKLIISQKDRFGTPFRYSDYFV
jgi:dTDP-4-dehydrorhamnose 3,5-epimerase